MNRRNFLFGVAATPLLAAIQPTPALAFVRPPRNCTSLSLLDTMDWKTEDGESRLHTIVGPPGVGRTSLALEIAWEYMIHGKKVLYIHDGTEIPRFGGGPFCNQLFNQTTQRDGPDCPQWKAIRAGEFDAFIWDVGLKAKAEWVDFAVQQENVTSFIEMSRLKTGFVLFPRTRTSSSPGVGLATLISHSLLPLHTSHTTTMLSKSEDGRMQLKQIKNRSSEPKTRYGLWEPNSGIGPKMRLFLMSA